MVIFPILASVMLIAHAGHDHRELSQARPNAVQVASRAAELQDKLRVVTDDRKAHVISNLNSRLTHLNNTWTENWTSTLERLSGILVKIESRSARLASEGKDASELNAAISDAKVYIAEAQSAVREQASKDYTFTVTNEQSLRMDIQNMISDFKTDVRAVMASVQQAREGVRLAMVELGQLTGEQIRVEREAQ